MAEEKDTATQAAQGTPPAEGSESSSVETPEVHNTEVDEQPGATGDDQDTGNPGSGEGDPSPGETDDQPGQGEAKTTRAERRIQGLISKIKEGQSGEHENNNADLNGKSPLFTDQEIEEGSVDPNALAERINKNTRSEVQRAIQMERVRIEYESAVKDHQSDLESIKDVDPDLEAEAVAEYERINYQRNPLSGEREFVPAVKLSEIITRIQSRAQKLAEKMSERIVEEDKEHLRDVSSSQAVPASGAPTGSGKVKAHTNDFASFEKAYSR